MKLVNIISKEIIADILTNHSMSVEDAIDLLGGEIHGENEDENVLIDGEWYYYDDLDYISDEEYEELLAADK